MYPCTVGRVAVRGAEASVAVNSKTAQFGCYVPTVGATQPFVRQCGLPKNRADWGGIGVFALFYVHGTTIAVRRKRQIPAAPLRSG